MVDWLDSAAGAAVDNFWVADDLSGSSIPNRVVSRPSLTLVNGPSFDADEWDTTSPAIVCNGTDQHLQADGISGYDGSFTIAIALSAPDLANNAAYWTINSSTQSGFDNYRFLRNSFNRLQLVSRDNAGGGTSSPLLGNTVPSVETVYVLGYDAEELLTYTYEMKGGEAVTLNDGFTVSPQIQDIDRLILFGQSISAGTVSNWVQGNFKACAMWTSFIGPTGALAVAEAIYNNANDWPSGDNEEGIGAASISLSGTADGSALVTSIASGIVLFDALGDARALSISDGGADVEVSATAVGESTVTSDGAASATMGATGAGGALALGSGESSVESTATAEGGALATGVGSAQIGVTAVAYSDSATTVDGAATLSLSATGATTTLMTGIGSAAVLIAAEATSELFSRGSASLALGASGDGASHAIADGLALSAFGALAAGVAVSSAESDGNAAVALSGQAEGRSRALADSSTSAVFSAAGIGIALVESAGQATISFAAESEPQASVSDGFAAIELVAQAQGVSTHIASGNASFTVSASGLTPDVIPVLVTGSAYMELEANAGAAMLATGTGDAPFFFTANGRRQVLAEMVQSMGAHTTRRRVVPAAPHRTSVVTP